MNYRRFDIQDRMPVYRMFRESIWDYICANGMDEDFDARDLDQHFREQKKYYVHLEENASEDWVAEDDKGKIVGWARSIEREQHLQLTHFFVSTECQGGGLGRELLDRAFPVGRGEQRSIIATINPRALSLYLRYDVNFQSMAFNFFGQPQIREWNSDLEVKQVAAGSQLPHEVAEIDSRVLGYKRPQELEFFMQNQPCYLFYREQQLAGYAFGWGNHMAGPAAALNADDLPCILQQIERSAASEKVETLTLTIPTVAQSTVRWALDSGYKMDTFHEVLLAKYPTMQLDRYLLTLSTFTW